MMIFDKNLPLSQIACRRHRWLLESLARISSLASYTLTMLWESDLAITCIAASVFIQFWGAYSLTDQPIHLLSLFRIEWTPTTTHFEQENAQWPEINVFPVTFLIEQDFRGQISVDSESKLITLSGRWSGSLSGPTECVSQLIIGKIRLRETKVTQCYMSRSVKQDVLRF